MLTLQYECAPGLVFAHDFAQMLLTAHIDWLDIQFDFQTVPRVLQPVNIEAIKVLSASIAWRVRHCIHTLVLA